VFAGRFAFPFVGRFAFAFGGLLAFAFVFMVFATRYVTQLEAFALLALSVYFNNGYAKVELGLAKGKKSYDKRQDLATRDAQKEINKAMGRRSKGMN